MDHIERQMRARNCPNPDDTPDFFKQRDQSKGPIDYPDTVPTKPVKVDKHNNPADRHEKGGGAKSDYNRSNTETF